MPLAFKRATKTSNSPLAVVSNAPGVVGKLGDCVEPSDVSAVAPVLAERNPLPEIDFRAAQVRGVNQSRAGRIQFGDERIEGSALHA